MSLPLEQAQFTINQLLRNHAASSGIAANIAPQPDGGSNYNEAIARARYLAMLNHARETYNAAAQQQQDQQQSVIPGASAAGMLGASSAGMPSTFRQSSSVPGAYEMFNTQTGMWEPFQGTHDDMMRIVQQQGVSSVQSGTNPAARGAGPSIPGVVPGGATPPLFTKGPGIDGYVAPVNTKGPGIDGNVNWKPTQPLIPTTPVPLVDTSKTPSLNVGGMPNGNPNIGAWSGISWNSAPGTPTTTPNTASAKPGYGSGDNPAWMNFLGGAPGGSANPNAASILDQRYADYAATNGSPMWTPNDPGGR